MKTSAATSHAPTRSGLHRRAFAATTLVISSMVFMGTAIVGMTVLFAHEAHRTRAVQAQTQLRQVLLAAVPLAQRELASNSAAHDVPMSLPVEGATLVLHVSPGSGGQVQVVAQTGYRGFKASQTLVFSRLGAGGGEWRLTAAALGQTGGQ